MSIDDVVKIVAGVLAGVGALLSFAFGIYQYRAKRRQESLAEIIQGEKETAAAAAVRIRDLKKLRIRDLKKLRIRDLKKLRIRDLKKLRFRDLKKINIRFIKRRRRRQELQALCLATVFERSGRTRSLIHDALKAQQVNHPDEIRKIIDQITLVIGRNASYTDLTRARRHLISLRSALSLDGDTRTRIDAIEIYTGAARKDGETPCGCKHEAHSWAQVRQPLLLFGKLVLVCQTQEKDSPNQSDQILGVPIITLDYHRTGVGSLSSHGWTLVDGKYAEPPRQAAEPPRQADVGLEQLANRLRLVIRTVESYSLADAIAVIPGTEHRYSDDLGKKLKEGTSLHSVPLSLEKGTRNFTVDRKDCEDRTFILLDDVYRTGRTFRDAASCLFAEGAKNVLGLAATCTISRIDLPCHHGPSS